MSDKLREDGKAWLLHQAEQQRLKCVASLREEANRTEAMTALDYLRKKGIVDLCPSYTPGDVLVYLRLEYRGSQHYRVKSDYGNEGSRLEVGIDGCDWDNVRDPWEGEREARRCVNCGRGKVSAEPAACFGCGGTTFTRPA